MGLLFTFISVLVLFYTIYTANLVQIGELDNRRLIPLLYAVIASLGGLAVLNIASLTIPSEEGVASDPLLVFVGSVLVFSALAASVVVIRSEAARLWVTQVIAEPTDYDPQSPVHLTAIVLSLSLVSYLLLGFVAQGGIAGVAEGLEMTGVAPVELVLTALLWIMAAALGVGLGQRRDMAAARQRLGLRMPRRADVGIGIGVGLALWLAAIAFAIFWQMLTAPETFAEQNLAADQLARSIDSLLLVLLVSVGAAVSEEIFVRGALQPVFGIVLTSLFFTVLHAQYLFAPSMLLIFGVSLTLGWLRRRYSTSAAIIAHFVYNFVPLLLAYLLVNASRGT
jgi:membrane protease YdiL (CAAX protease family)